MNDLPITATFTTGFPYYLSTIPIDHLRNEALSIETVKRSGNSSPSVSQQYLTVEEGDILSPMLPKLHIIGD